MNSEWYSDKRRDPTSIAEEEEVGKMAERIFLLLIKLLHIIFQLATLQTTMSSFRKGCIKKLEILLSFHVFSPKSIYRPVKSGAAGISSDAHESRKRFLDQFSLLSFCTSPSHTFFYF